MFYSFVSKLKHHLILYKYLYGISIIIFIFYYFSLPKKLFITGYSTVVVDKNGQLIGARIANDGQWRFPTNDTAVSSKFKICLVQFEDRYFFKHPGFNPVALLRAVRLNIKARHIVSGASTISMQVIRMHRKTEKRTVLEKAIELILATRLEFRYSKNEILSIYYNHAPFGGNVVGIQAASWRFFGRSPQNLSWAEASLLAVLPNSPSSIHISRNRQKLINKRNKLLFQLYTQRMIDYSTYSLSLLETLPDKPFPLPDLTPHITASSNQKKTGDIIQTTVDMRLQENISRILNDYMPQLLSNEISNACVLVIDVKRMDVLAYLGNIPGNKFKVEGQDVDIIVSPRSTGSILKPVLYAVMQSEGAILPATLIPDIPTLIGGFKPENYDQGFDGAVPAKRALSRSLNIPCVRLLQKYGIPKFQNLLTRMGMTTLIYPPDHYGLTLIIGGAEGKLWDIAGMYSKMAYTLNHFNQQNKYPDSIPEIHYLKNLEINQFQSSESYNNLDAGSIYLTFQALLEVNRPDEESGWVNLGSSRTVAWKTGTSYGFRDAWAVGTTPEYVVGVWVGNADGEGRPGLTGIGAAAPLMFQVFSLLPSTSWFKTPFDALEKIPVCRLSGYKAGNYCTTIDTTLIARKGVESGICPYHTLLHLSADKKYRVTQQCYSIDKMKVESWFILPPVMEWFYRKKNLFYKTIPPVMSGCLSDDPVPFMEFIYPSDFVKIFIPRGFDGDKGSVIFEIAHRNPHVSVFWHVDNRFIATTQNKHQISVSPEVGAHYITVVDEEGRSLTKKFEIVDK